MSSYYEKILATGEVKCIDEEVPFEIPTSWSWARLTHVTFLIEDCPHSTAKDEGKGYPLVRTPNIGFGSLLLNGVHRVSEKVYNQRNVRAVPQKNDLIFAREAPAGNIAVIQDEKVCLGQRTVLLRPITHCIFPQYLAYFILAPSSQQSLVEKSSGTTVAHVNLSDFRPYLIAVPPIDEQKRIVNKLKELLPLLDKYNCYADKLSSLNNEINNLLKKSILQEAIQGKLVPQIDEEGSAQKLLEKIKAEKQKLFKEGKLKKSALNDSVIFRGDDNKYYEQIGKKCWDITEQIPFEIPSNWEWCRVRNVSNSYIGLTYKPTDIDEKGTIVLRSCNIRNGKLELDDIVRVSSFISEKMLIEENDIIICARNGSKRLVGKSTLIRNLPEPMTFGAFMAICKTPIYEYMFAYLQSDLFFGQLRDVSNTTTINQLTQNKFNDFLIPIPPVREQERIAFKISQLFQELR